MQLSLHIRDARDLQGDAVCHADGGITVAHAATLERSGKLGPFSRQVAALLAQHFGEAPFRRVAFGTEFCENLIPKPEQLAAVLQAADARGLGVTLLTPPVANGGLAKLRPLLALMDDGQPHREVAFADWGVLNVLRQHHPRVLPVQGRLLQKSLRDPRVMGLYGEAGDTPSLAALQRSNLDCATYHALLRRFAVGMVELDVLPQGTVLEGIPTPAALYLPYGVISTARVCQAAGLGYRPGEKFQPAAPCRQECQTHLVEYTYTNSPFANQDQQFWLKGNTHLYAHTPAMLQETLAQAKAGSVARLVFQPRVPVLAADAIDGSAALSRAPQQAVHRSKPVSPALVTIQAAPIATATHI